MLPGNWRYLQGHRYIMLPGNWRYLQGLIDTICYLAAGDTCMDSNTICCLATGDPCRDSQIKYATWQLEIPAGTHRYNMLPGSWRCLQGLIDTICCLAAGDTCRDSQIQYAAWQLEIPARTHRYNMLPDNFRSLQGLTDTICFLPAKPNNNAENLVQKKTIRLISMLLFSKSDSVLFL